MLTQHSIKSQNLNPCPSCPEVEWVDNGQIYDQWIQISSSPCALQNPLQVCSVLVRYKKRQGLCNDNKYIYGYEIVYYQYDKTTCFCDILDQDNMKKIIFNEILKYLITKAYTDPSIFNPMPAPVSSNYDGDYIRFDYPSCFFDINTEQTLRSDPCSPNQCCTYEYRAISVKNHVLFPGYTHILKIVNVEQISLSEDVCDSDPLYENCYYICDRFRLEEGTVVGPHYVILLSNEFDKLTSHFDNINYMIGDGRVNLKTRKNIDYHLIVQIYDIIGNLMNVEFNEIDDNNIVIDLQNYNNGFYIIKIQYGGQYFDIIKYLKY